MSVLCSAGHLTMQQAGEVVAVLHEMAAAEAYGVALLMLDTGLEPFEILQWLAWEDFAFDPNGTLTIKSAPDSLCRCIPLSERAADAILARRGHADGPFITDNAWQHEQAISDAFADACLKAQVPQVELGSLCCTFGHELLEGLRSSYDEVTSSLCERSRCADKCPRYKQDEPQDDLVTVN